MFANWKKRFFKDTEGEFDDGAVINEKTHSRNKVISTVALTLLVLAAFTVYKAVKKPAAPVSSPSSVEFGTIIEPDFTEKDNQSALSMQQGTITTLTKTLEDLSDDFETLKSNTSQAIEKAKKENKRQVEQQVAAQYREKETLLNKRILELEALNNGSSDMTQATPIATSEYSTINNPDIFGQRKLPPRPTPISRDNPDIDTFQYQPSEKSAFSNDAFDSHDFYWESFASEAARRTKENYVPTGTFVTAIITGGADANAGVLGQGDTSPIVFQTVNKGILPNGEQSKLGDCTVTGAVYGEISSSRGIVRTNRMSCIQQSGDILDIPVRGTAFNFGRNGIRGTTILKNGEIVKMAGISGILTGIGETGAALSQTTSTSALGTTQAISGDDAALNLLGNATSSVGSKLADYYIQLAEMYHPIVEVNPGNIVNIVFLEGFPLDPVLAKEYEQEIEMKESMVSNSNQILDVITNPPINPLATELSNQGIEDVPTTPFGRK